MILIETAEQLNRNIHVIQDKALLGLDCETTGLDAIKDELRLVQLGPPEERLIIDVFKTGRRAVSEALRPILEDKNVSKTLHNAKFDLKFIKHHLGIDVERIFDSYLVSILLEGGITPKEENDNGKMVAIKGYHGLKQNIERHLNETISKEEQKSDWSGELSQSQLEYADKDVEKLFPLREALTKKLTEEKLRRCAKLEFEAVLPTAAMELNGFYMDFEEWMRVAHESKEQSYILAAEICEELKDVIEQGSLFGEVSINLNSPQQVQKYFRAYGVPMPDSTKEFFLTPLIKDYPIIEKFIEYKGLSKAETSFGDNYREFINPITGRIHADFMQIGAGTGRYATARPNLSQIPADKAHRNCFQAEKGNKLIISDFSQEELRLLAEFSGDKAFRQAFIDGDDFHIATAAQIFKIPIDQIAKSSPYRDMAKRMNFLLTYGGGAPKFAMSAGITLHEAELIMKTYFSTFKSVDRWLKYQQHLVLRTRCARSVSGRITKYDFDYDDWGKRSHAQREAANMPMQGSGADILKRAMRIFYDISKPYHPRVKLVNIVHDELIVESPAEIAEDIANLLESAMKQSWHENVEHVGIKIDTHILDKWEKM